jgi:hypothetical protein
VVNPNEAELTTIEKAGPLRTNGNFLNNEEHKFSRMRNGFAGDFHCRYYSCSFGKFMFQMFSAWTTWQDKLIRFPRGSGCWKGWRGGPTFVLRKVLPHYGAAAPVGIVSRIHG